MILAPPNLLLFLLLSIQILAPTYCHPRDTISGYFSHYTQSPTDGTIAYHQDKSGLLPHDMASYKGVVATVDCSLVGQDAWIYITDQRATPGLIRVWLPVKVFDCSGHTSTTDWMNQNNIVGELGYYLARDMGLLYQGGIVGEIVFQDPFSGPLVCYSD